MFEALTIMAFGTSAVAILRGRSGLAWFIIGGLLPVVGLILVNLLPRLPRLASPVRSAASSEPELVIRITLR